MKKVFILCTALMFMMSISANEHYRFRNHEKQERIDYAKGYHVQKESIQRTSLQENKSMAPGRVQYALPTKMRTAQQAQDTIIITANKLAQWEYSERYEDWYCGFYDIENKYLVRIDYLSKQKLGTFTHEQFDYEFTYLTDLTKGMYGEVIKVDSCVATFDEGEEYIDIKATMRSVDGVIYKIQLYRRWIVPKDSVRYTGFTNVTHLKQPDSFQFHGENTEGVGVDIRINSKTVLGVFETEDFVPNTGFSISIPMDGKTDKKVINYVDAGAEITAKGGKYNIDAYMIGADSIYYGITMAYDLPKPIDTTCIQIGNLKLLDLTIFGLLWADGYNNDWKVSLTLRTSEIQDGEYDVNRTVLIHTLKQDTIPVAYATATITTVDTKQHIHALIYGENNKLYDVNMAFVIPEPKDTVPIHFETTAEIGNIAYYGEYIFTATNDMYMAQVAVFTDKLEGTFEGEDFDPDYSGVMIYKGSDTISVDVMDGKATLRPSNDTIYVTAEMICTDSIQYNITMFYAPPLAKGERTILVPNAKMENYIELDGAYQLHGTTADSAYYVSIVPRTDNVTGTFDFLDLEGSYSAVNTIKDGKVDSTIYFMHGTVVVTMSADSIITMKADLLGLDTILYKITMTGKYAEPSDALDYDAEEGQVDRIYTTADSIGIYDHTDESFIQFIAKDVVKMDVTSIAFNVNTSDPVITIPPAVYPIDYSGDLGTVDACQGVIGGSVYPSYYSALGPDGKLGDPIFFMVEGTVTVENRGGYLYFEVNAKNSVGLPIHIIYNGEPTGVDNISDTGKGRVTKILENGRIVILRGEKKLNLLGATLQ